ncbi:MAG: hypothetical protein WBV69_10645 [Candidatus Sulfotelmatobacter sp.]
MVGTFYMFVCLLLASLAYGQAAQPVKTADAETKAEHSPRQSEDAPVKVGPDDPVITLNGFCADLERKGSACKTVVTRSQFERLTEALQPGMSLSLRLNVANAYALNLKMSAAAEKRGLDKTPAFDEEMRFARMQLLAQDLSRALQSDANNVSEADLEDYYKRNQPSYEQATLARIFIPIPRAKQVAEAQEEHESGSAVAQSSITPNDSSETNTKTTATAEEAMTKLAADLRARAVNGEDPDKLQTEAYAQAGFGQTTSDTKLEKVRRTALPPRHERVMDLKPGEVSEVFSDPSGAHFIYKMISKETLKLEDVTAEIRTQISSQRYRDSTKSFQGDVVFNDNYFNPPADSSTTTEPRSERRKKIRTQPN